MSDLDTLRRVLDELGWEPEPEENVSGFHIDFGSPHFPVSTAFAAVTEDTKEFFFYINLGVKAPPECHERLALLITRINWQLSIGNFELDLTDGLLRFRTSFAFGGSDLSPTLICNAIERAMAAVEAYGAELISAVQQQEPQ